MDPAAQARYMARALRLARRGWCTTTPNPRVGCVLVSQGEIIGEGWHEKAGEGHAEVRALEEARRRGRDTAGASAFVTLEPCCVQGRTPACTAALIRAGVKRVYLGATDPNPRVNGGGIAQLEAAGIEVVQGLLSAECESLNPGFSLRMTLGRPRFRVKVAMSLDGRTAAANGESQWITGPAARQEVHRLRRESCAVLTGSGTLRADDPQLTVRHVSAARQPARVLLDTDLQAAPGSRLFDGGAPCIVFTGSDNAGRRQALERIGITVIQVARGESGLHLMEVARQLGDLAFNEVMVEAGAELAGAFVEAGLADELIIYLAPQLIGDGGRAMLSLPGLQGLADRISLDIRDIRAVGEDWRIIARPRRPA